MRKEVRTTKHIPKGTIILSFEKNFVGEPTTKTLRISEKIHQMSTDPSAAENFLNHSCQPNSYVNFYTLDLIALKDILLDETVTYNYFTSDWGGEDNFVCSCNSPHCKKHITGFRTLSMEERLLLKHYLSPYLLSRLNDF